MQTHVIESDGIVGLFKRLKSSAGRPDPLKLIIRTVAVAAFILIYKKSGAPLIGVEMILVALLLGVAGLMAEYYMAREVCRSWHERKIAPLLMFALLWAGAFAYSCNNWLGVASEGQFEKAGISKAAYQTRQIADKDVEATEAELTMRRDALDKLKSERLSVLPTVAGKPVGSADEAQAIVARLETNTRFMTLTKGCTETKGKDTRKYCDELGEARAAIAAHNNRAKLDKPFADAEAAFKVAQAAYASARAKLELTPVAISGERNDLRIYTRYLGASQESAMDMQAVGTIIFVSLLLSGLGFMEEARAHRGAPRKPWPIVTFISRALYGGKTVRHTQEIVETSVSVPPRPAVVQPAPLQLMPIGLGRAA